MSRFAPGDVVKLRFFDTTMTVEFVRKEEDITGGHDAVHVMWFDKNDNLHRDCFIGFQLVQVKL